MADPCISEVMSTVESWTHSRRLQAAAAAERARIESELARVQVREAELRRELVICQQRRHGLEGELTVLARFGDEGDSHRVRPHFQVVGLGAAGAAVTVKSQDVV
jgi:hypothetical protein